MPYERTLVTAAGNTIRIGRANADSPTYLKIENGPEPTTESAELDGDDVTRLQTMLEEAEEI